MLKLPVKVHIPLGGVTEFLLRNTNLDIKELIPKAVADYIRRNTGERLTKSNIQICEKNDKIPTYITVYFDGGNAEIIDFLNKLNEKKISTICRNIFEAKFISERFDFLMNNRCFIPDVIERKAELTLSDIITNVTAGKDFRTTIADLMKVRGQQKRTDSFVNDLYSRFGNAGVCITTLDGTALSEDDFKDMDKAMEIVVCMGGHRNITDSDGVLLS